MKKKKFIFVEIAVIDFILRKKYEEHLKFCQTNKAQILMPSQNKYLQFKNLKIQFNIILFVMRILKVIWFIKIKIYLNTSI